MTTAMEIVARVTVVVGLLLIVRVAAGRLIERLFPELYDDDREASPP